MVQYDAKPDLNLLLARFSGDVTKEETEKGLDDASRALTALARNFRLLTDLRTLRSMDIACAPFIERAMDLFQEHGIAEVIRIIPDPTHDIGLQIMSSFHYGPGVRLFTCSTLEEALNLLASGGLDQETIRAQLA